MKTKHIYFLLYSLLIVILIILNIDNPFFWDKDILDSKQAHWFIENNFNLIMPDAIDAGHPPFVGFLLAILWTIFGKNLVVGHVLMGIVAIGVAYQLYRLVNYFFKDNFVPPVLAVTLAEAALLSQMVIVSSDLILTFFFLLTLNAILNNKNTLIFIGAMLLALVNLRGMTTAFALGLLALFINRQQIKTQWQQIIKVLLPFALAAIPGVTYLIFHWITKGWFVHHDDSNWQGCYETVDFNGFIQNCIVYTWRMLDAGRVLVWGIGFVITILLWKKKYHVDDNIKTIGTLFVLLIVISIPSSLMANMLIDNRYYLPLFIMLSLSVSYLISTSHLTLFVRKSILTVLFISLFSGTFWIYPTPISNCWSATLAHLPYHELRYEMNEFIKEAHIGLNQVGTFVPYCTSDKYVFLNNSDEIFNRRDFDQHKYIIYSNVFNASDEDLEQLATNWKVIKSLEKGQVNMILYKRQ